MGETFPGATSVLSGKSGKVVEDWLDRYQRSRLRVPGDIDRRALASPARGIVAALAGALTESPWVPGSAALRETEKLVAFAGGSFGMASASAFDVLAFVMALRDVLLDAGGGGEERAALGLLFDWLGALAAEGYASSREDALSLRHRDSLERGTPVVMVNRELPAALLVGEPDRGVLESVFGRLLLLTVRVDARAVIIDGGGLANPLAPAVLEALAVFANHKRVKGILTILSNLPPPAEAEWTAVFPASARVACAERFDDAVVQAVAAGRRA